MTDNTGQKTN